MNHNLRGREGKLESEVVAERAAAMGLTPVICSLDLSAKLVGGRASMQTAREGRLAALTSACLERGIKTILTGHTLHDQLETFMLRTMRASGKQNKAHERELRAFHPFSDFLSWIPPHSNLCNHSQV